MAILAKTRNFLSGEATSTSKPPLFLAFRSSTRFIIATVLIAIFTDLLVYGIIVPVMPFSLTNRVGIPESSLQTWNAILLACYTIALFITSPLFGMYADHTTSRRWPLLLGLFALAGSTLLLCLGRTIALLILGRALQGASAAMVWTVGLALLADTMGKKIGMAMGYVSIAMSLGLLISPAIGGAVFAAVGYYAVFYVSFGCIFLDILLRLLMIEKKVARQWIPDEPEDEIVSVTNNHAATSAISDNPDVTVAETQGQIIADKADSNNHQVDVESVTVQSRTWQAKFERATKRHPKLRLLRSRRNLGANVGIIAQAGIMFAFDTVLPLFVKATFDWNSTAAGLVFFALFIPGFTSPIVGYFSDKYGARWPSTFGFVLAIPLLICLRFVTENTIGHKILLCALLAMLGVSLTFYGTPLMAEITYAIEEEEAKTPGVFGPDGVYGLAYGIFCLSFALGGSIGTLMAGYVMAGAGWQTVTWVLAIWCAAGGVVVFWGVGAKAKSAASVPGATPHAASGESCGIAHGHTPDVVGVEKG